MRTHTFLTAGLTLVLSASTPAATTSSIESQCDQIIHSKGTVAEPQRLRTLFAAEWKYENTEYPEYATETGYPGQNNRWTDLSLSAIERRNREARAPLKAIESIDRSQLSAADQLNYDLFQWNMQENVDGTRFHSEYLALSQLDGVQQSAAQTLAMMPTDRASDYQDILGRLRGLPKYIEQSIELLKEGQKLGITPPKITMRDVPDQVKAQMEKDFAKNPLTVTLQKAPENVKREAIHVLEGSIIPAFGRLHDFLVETYIPACRESIAWTALPDGKAWYDYKVKYTTTTKLSPDQIHEIGMREVKRIRAEMDKIIVSTGFKGSFADFSDFLRTDSRFFYENAHDLLTGYRDIAKRIDPQLMNLFGKLPRTPYGVKPVPSYAEKSQTTAYYEPGSPEAHRPGYFMANTYNLKTRPKWEMESLTLHEAVPGHHLQISLASELTGVPDFRRYHMYTAFVEGWGLYSESLGGDLGLYTDPYSKFGQLTYEMWRAIRLVVDTGMHAKGWTRDQAIEFFKQNTSKTEHDIVVEIDRYIVWAGQALAYKIGQLKITELREWARLQLGDGFDIRQYHDVVLQSGAIPLETLEKNVHQWVARLKHKKK